MNKLSENLKILRENRELTQREVATILETNNATYNRYEKGAREPDVDTLIKLSDLYSVSLDALVGRKPTKGDVSIQEIKTKREMKEEVVRMVRETATNFLHAHEKELVNRINDKFNLK